MNYVRQSNRVARGIFNALLIIGFLAIPAPSFGNRIGYSKETKEAEAKKIAILAEAGDAKGLIAMLSEGVFPSKVRAAEHLGEIGDKTALPALGKLNKDHGGWRMLIRDHEYSGAFPLAVCKILVKNKSVKEKVEALFDLLEGRGAAIPESAKYTESTSNGKTTRSENYLLKRNWDVGKRVAAELDKYVTPEIVQRLRKSVNKGAAVAAVWMEIRDMPVKDGIAWSMTIARDEGGAQGYGAIHSLKNYGEKAITALDTLADEGHREAIMVLGYQRENQAAFDILCKHLLNNDNSYIRMHAVSQVSYVQAKELKLKSIQTLIRALYDPLERIRTRAAGNLKSNAYKHNKACFDPVKESLIVAAAKHPDQKIREELTIAVERLGYQITDDTSVEIPQIRTDLSVSGWTPKNAKQRLDEKTRPLEEKVAKLLKLGPASEAVTIYQKLLTLNPGYKAYEQGLGKAREYVKAAKESTEHWYEDAPFIGVKGRYSYYLANVDKEMGDLKEKYELASYLSSEHFANWTGIFSDDPKKRDQYIKACKLYEHIINNYPKNEYKVISSKVHLAGTVYNLDQDRNDKDTKDYILARLAVITTPVQDITDSTNPRGNKPLKDAGGMTQVQKDFEKYFKYGLRERIIELSKSDRLEMSLYLLGEIMTKCRQTDPEMVAMAEKAISDIQLKIRKKYNH
ncbi:MAG: hypothetical protein K9M57_07785 [Phycisphaerae bacterium]|nr:hypothetical protein [Phycisphaerae bacterium]